MESRTPGLDLVGAHGPAVWDGTVLAGNGGAMARPSRVHDRDASRVDVDTLFPVFFFFLFFFSHVLTLTQAAG